MSSFFSKLVSTVGEQVGSYVTDQIIESLDPKVRTEVTEHVKEFQDGAIRDIPGTIEAKLEAGEGSDDLLKSVISNLLSGRTGPLVEKLIVLIKPKVDEATADLPNTITDSGMAYVREFLDLSKTGEGEGETTSRDLGGRASSVLSDTLGSLMNLDDRLVAFLGTLKEQLHPLFEAVKPKIWDLIPSLLQEALEQVFDSASGESAAEPAAEQPEQAARGLVGDFFRNQVQGQVVDQAPRMLTLVEEPVQGLIAKIVDALEAECNEAFGTRLKQEMVEHNLLQA